MGRPVARDGSSGGADRAPAAGDGGARRRPLAGCARGAATMARGVARSPCTTAAPPRPPSDGAADDGDTGRRTRHGTAPARTGGRAGRRRVRVSGPTGRRAVPRTDWPTAPLPPGVDQAVDRRRRRRRDGRARCELRRALGGRRAGRRDRVRALPPERRTRHRHGVVLGRQELHVGDRRAPRRRRPAGPRRAPAAARVAGRRSPAAITLRQLLQMSSGLQWDEVQSLVTMGLDDARLAERGGDHGPAAARARAGSAFEYSTGTSALVAGIAADALGGCAALDAYVHERLLDPIGITTRRSRGRRRLLRRWPRDGHDGPRLRPLRPALRPRRHVGRRQVVPTSWVDETRVPAATNAAVRAALVVGPHGQRGRRRRARRPADRRRSPAPTSSSSSTRRSGHDAPAATLVGADRRGVRRRQLSLGQRRPRGRRRSSGRGGRWPRRRPRRRRRWPAGRRRRAPRRGGRRRRRTART